MLPQYGKGVVLIKTTGREFFYSVPGLAPPEYTVSDELTGHLEDFVEHVPKITESLEQFENHNLPIGIFVEVMKRLYTMLCSIHAYWLEIEADRILKLPEIDEGKLCRALLAPFITNVRTLAIDIQMAQSKGFDVQRSVRAETERYKDVVSSMRVVMTLLEKGDNKKAFDIAKGTNELQESSYMLPLISSIMSNNINKALSLTAEIYQLYQQKIECINQPSANNNQQKIVVVDDMPEILTVVSYMLKEHYQVLPFKEGSEALKAIETRHEPDALLLDIDMPTMSGFKLAEKIRQNPKYENIPILFLTANSTKENLLKSVLYRPKSFIVKPVNKDILIARLEGCLDGYAGG